MQGIEYLNARIRARKKDFIDRKTYEALLKGYDLPVFIELLLTTRYGPFLNDRLKKQRDIRAILFTLSDFVEKELAWVLSNSDDYISRLLRIFLCRWDLINLKAIFCSKLSSRSNELIRSIGVINRSDCDHLSKVSFREAVDILEKYRLPFIGKDVSRLVRKLEFDHDVKSFCRSLDKSYFNGIYNDRTFRRKEMDLFREVFKTEVDRRNIMEILLLIIAGRQKHWKPFGFYGHLGLSFLRSMAEFKSVEDALNSLTSTIYSGDVLNGILLYERTGELNYIERLIEQAFKANIMKRARIEPLSIAVPLAYIGLLKNEYANLSLIALGERYGIVSNLVKRKLIIFD